MTDYQVPIISLMLIIVYLLSFAMVKLKVIGYSLHKKVWNWLLFGFFLVSSVLGTLLALRISNGLALELPFDMLYWHVEAGIAMTLIAVFHVIWHWRYFAMVFKKPN